MLGRLSGTKKNKRGMALVGSGNEEEGTAERLKWSEDEIIEFLNESLSLSLPLSLETSNMEHVGA
jgi:hypothetical protein